MRRVARTLIRWSCRLDPVTLYTKGRVEQTGVDLANRTIQYAGQLAGMGWAARVVEGLAGANPSLPNRGPARKPSLRERVADWLELTDYGYGLGLLAGVGASVAAIFQLWWLAAPLIIAAFLLCWWFG
ncbi:hypothetical protein [Mycolicibacterium mageritense]|nr:hypothetical protein [Mycolicibacterium mageritense]